MSATWRFTLTRAMGIATINRRRKQWERVSSELVHAVAEEFPVGRRCAIVRYRKGLPYKIWGEICSTAHSIYFPMRIGVRTNKSGKVMFANYDDLNLRLRG